MPRRRRFCAHTHAARGAFAKPHVVAPAAPRRRDRGVSFASFEPDILVEVTTVCDRACPGCYSPTVRSKDAPAVVYARYPERFLAPSVLGRELAALGESGLVIALRGGEPSRHPGLADVVRVASRYARTLYVETHGRWVVERTLESLRLVEALAAPEAIVKISFDAMHGMRPALLREAIATLDRAGAAWVVAITEPDDVAFARTRATCDWIADARI